MRQNQPIGRGIIIAEPEVIYLKTVVYADILVIINLIINYLLLRASAAVTGSDFKTSRFLLASAIGGAFSLIIYIENIPVVLDIIIKLLFILIMVFTAFGIKSTKAFLKCCAAFFLVNFAFAGIMFAICTMLIPNAAVYQNGIVYFDISLLTLTVSAIICYCVLSIISRLTKSRTPEKSIYSIRIFYDKKSVEGKALFDTGNSLSDCFSSRPVIIAEKDFVQKICNKDITEMHGFRLVPFSTIKNGGALPAFLSEKIEICINGEWIEAKEIYIAVTDRKIISGSYSALIGTPFFDTINNRIKGGKALK